MNTKISTELMKELNRLKMTVYRRGHQCSWEPWFSGETYKHCVRFEIDRTGLHVSGTDEQVVVQVEQYMKNRNIPLETESEEVERLLSEYD
jgi:hypothetical protein